MFLCTLPCYYADVLMLGGTEDLPTVVLVILNHNKMFFSFSATLLNIPGFIERLCKLATRKVSETTGTSSFLQELEEWYTWLDNALVLDALMRVANEEAEQSSTGIWPAFI